MGTHTAKKYTAVYFAIFSGFARCSLGTGIRSNLLTRQHEFSKNTAIKRYNKWWSYIPMKSRMTKNDLSAKNWPLKRLYCCISMGKISLCPAQLTKNWLVQRSVIRPHLSALWLVAAGPAGHVICGRGRALINLKKTERSGKVNFFAKSAF